MIRGNSGFVLPLTLGLMLIISTVVLYHTERYVTEKRFFFEQGEIVTMESLIQMSTVDLLADLQEGRWGNTGQYVYKKGVVQYRLQSETEESISFLLHVKTFQERQHFIQLKYDKNKKIITEMREG